MLVEYVDTFCDVEMDEDDEGVLRDQKFPPESKSIRTY